MFECVCVHARSLARRPTCGYINTEWDAVNISFVISHPQSHFCLVAEKLTGLSRWIILGD